MGHVKILYTFAIYHSAKFQNFNMVNTEIWDVIFWVQIWVIHVHEFNRSIFQKNNNNNFEQLLPFKAWKISQKFFLKYILRSRDQLLWATKLGKNVSFLPEPFQKQDP